MKKEEKDITIKIKPIKFKEIDDLDFELKSLFTNDDETFINIIETDRNLSQYPISIEKLKDFIKLSENDKATHISIDYNIDHYSYYFETYNIEKVPNDEYKKENNKIKNLSQNLNEKIKKLKELSDKLNDETISLQKRLEIYIHNS